MPLGSTVPAIEQRLVEADCVRKAPTATEFEPYILSRADAAPRRLETERPRHSPTYTAYPAAHASLRMPCRVGSLKVCVDRHSWVTLLGAKQAPYGLLRDTVHGGVATSAASPMPLQAPVGLQLPWAYFDGAYYSRLC